jgi:hypothetical protein
MLPIGNNMSLTKLLKTKRIILSSLCILFFISVFISGCIDLPVDLQKEFFKKSKNFPYILKLYSEDMFDSVLVNNPNGLVLLRFHSFNRICTE